jgi:hypothetical protein
MREETPDKPYGIMEFFLLNMLQVVIDRKNYEDNLNEY